MRQRRIAAREVNRRAPLLTDPKPALRRRLPERPLPRLARREALVPCRDNRRRSYHRSGQPTAAAVHRSKPETARPFDQPPSVSRRDANAAARRQVPPEVDPQDRLYLSKMPDDSYPWTE